jgi:cytoskeletal protein RodZ
MTTQAKIKLFLVIAVLILAGVIPALLTTNRDLIKPYPKEADVKVIFTSPPPLPTSEPLSPTEEPTETPKPTEKPTTKPKPTEEESSPSAEPTTEETPTPTPAKTE